MNKTSKDITGRKRTIKGKFSTGEVWLDGKFLDPSASLKARNHSPTGFAWGYGGSGPAQLALAILLEIFGEEVALSKYQQFKWDIIARLRNDDFEGEIIVFEKMDFDDGQMDFSFKEKEGREDKTTVSIFCKEEILTDSYKA